MYNGIGLRTVRGSGTNGYVQRNLSYVNPNRSRQRVSQNPSNGQRYNTIQKESSRPINAEILYHEQKRAIEVKALELTVRLQDEGAENDTIVAQVEEKRKEWIKDLEDSRQQGTVGRKSTNSHQKAQIKEKENARLKQLFRIPEDYMAGESFDPEKKEKRRQERLEKQEKRREEARTAKERELKSNQLETDNSRFNRKREGTRSATEDRDRFDSKPTVRKMARRSGDRGDSRRLSKRSPRYKTKRSTSRSLSSSSEKSSSSERDIKSQPVRKALRHERVSSRVPHGSSSDSNSDSSSDRSSSTSSRAYEKKKSKKSASPIPPVRSRSSSPSKKYIKEYRGSGTPRQQVSTRVSESPHTTERAGKVRNGGSTKIHDIKNSRRQRSRSSQRAKYRTSELNAKRTKRRTLQHLRPARRRRRVRETNAVRILGRVIQLLRRHVPDPVPAIKAAVIVEQARDHLDGIPVVSRARRVVVEALVERGDDIRVDRAEDMEAYLRRKYNKFAVRIMYASSLELQRYTKPVFNLYM
ncbi:unnamed protein product [Albugo candida]|uniref:CWF21 domain-containing protein n=1 Tax=Albugo candida TaxID=65357 RepID=A0A024GIS3_9STRA|nr:unnamed protein product [Albugo candida]|eukprot:CCI46793.1 unnamed protein product [Albugo candida]